MDVLLVRPPFTEFSRANPDNHLSNDSRNKLVAKASELAHELSPDFVFMENAREVFTGNFREYFAAFIKKMEGLGYKDMAEVNGLNKFGLHLI